MDIISIGIGVVIGLIVGFIVAKFITGKANKSKIEEMNAKADQIIKEARISASRIESEADMKVEKLISQAEIKNEKTKQRKIQEAKDKFARYRSEFENFKS